MKRILIAPIVLITFPVLVFILAMTSPPAFLFTHFINQCRRIPFISNTDECNVSF
ncbi:MAG: hypothetical protein HQK77_09360 [Desulfobacterales bacterium]|nr:hypothetical protein [Desulfobacterales bacterium]